MQMQTRTFSQQEIIDAGINAINTYRKVHAAPLVKGSRQINVNAQNWSEYLAGVNKVEATTLGIYGSSVATSFKETEIEAVRDAVKAWYEGSKFYNYDNPGEDKNTGSFCALVWRDTTEVGIGVAWNEMEKHWVVTAFFYPPVQRGKFRENILPPK